MALDLRLFSGKLRDLRDQLGVSHQALSDATGMALSDVEALDAGTREPTGDQILILADYFRCDFKFFISNEIDTTYDRSRTLFRRLGDRITASDRWAIQEFLFLCECEHEFERALDKSRPAVPAVSKHGAYFKRHGHDAATAARRALGLGPDDVPRDVFASARALGVRVFRRRLESHDLSGLYLSHPVAGPCVLVNYDEDPFRQRFTASHELAHALLDRDEEVVISGKWTTHELVETRANAFASEFLLPKGLLSRLPDPNRWSSADLATMAVRLFVNTQTLLIAVGEAGLIETSQRQRLAGARVPRSQKVDVELPESLAPGQRRRRLALLEKGLSVAYAHTVFEAYRRELITAARASEALLASPLDLPRVAADFGEAIPYDD